MSNDKKDYSKTEVMKTSIDEKIAKMKEELIERQEQSKPKEQESLKDLLAKADEHVQEVKNFVLKYTGKIGYNPFIWLRNNNFSLAESILKEPNLFDESTIRTILTKVLSIKALPPVAVNPVIPTVRQILPKEVK